jgi:hypothetical protein
LNRDEQRQLLAEQTTLRKLIAEIPAGDVLDRASFEARLQSVEQRLAQAQAEGLPTGGEQPIDGPPALDQEGTGGTAPGGVMQGGQFLDQGVVDGLDEHRGVLSQTRGTAR